MQRTSMEDGIGTLGTEVLIVADDLTGACDAGVHFAARGMQAVVGIAPEGFAGCDAAVIVWNTDTRCSDARLVREQLEPALALVRERKPKHLLKKVDSVMRGPVEQEIAWMLEQMEIPLAVLAPAFPGAGRVVQDGRVVVHANRVAVDIAACFPHMKCAHVPRTETGSLPERIAVAIEDGTRLLIVDAENDADMLRIARAERMAAKVLWAGSGGLARAMAMELAGGCKSAVQRVANGPVLICVGSDHAVTVEQIRRLEQELNVTRVRADEAGFLATKAALKRGSNVVLEFSREQLEAKLEMELGVKAGVRYCGGLILTGGDTAMHVLGSLGAQSMELKAEIEAGIPWGEVRGGAADGKMIVTKSGGFGSSGSLLECVKYLNSHAACEQKAEIQ